MKLKEESDPRAGAGGTWGQLSRAGGKGQGADRSGVGLRTAPEATGLPGASGLTAGCLIHRRTSPASPNSVCSVLTQRLLQRLLLFVG